MAALCPLHRREDGTATGVNSLAPGEVTERCLRRQAVLASEGQEVVPAPDRHGQQGAGLPSSPSLPVGPSQGP